MSSKFLHIVALCLVASTATGEDLLPKAHVHFRRFMDDFGRQYANDNETRMRFEIFKRSLQRIDEQNAGNENAIFGTVEGQYAIKIGKLLEFSVQQLQDCYPGSFCNNGGNMANALAFTASKYEGGIMSEQDYPYIDGDQTCAFDKSKIKTTVSGCTVYKLQSEDALKELLYSHGPLAVALVADSLQTYKHGIIQHSVGEKINYSMLIVGYGTENGVPYWIMKNSWGAHWGEKGYARAERGTNQMKIMSPDGQIVTAVL